MLSTASGVAQSFLAPSLMFVVEETNATSTGSNSTVAKRDRTVTKQTRVTTRPRSCGFW